MENLLEEFAQPSAKYRPIPFWSWNDALDEKEIRSQVQELKKGGMGGYFMHARSGLKVEYLSEEWFKCISAGVDEAGKEGLGAWIYDEEGWPSGFAGGRVPAQGEDYQAKFITAVSFSDCSEAEDQRYLFVYRLSEDGKKYCRINPREKRAYHDGGHFIGIERHVNPFYIDTMNKRAVTAFLRSTHEEYYSRFRADFGKKIRGFFTDEPRLACNNFGEIAWSDDLPKVFMDKYGYDICDELPALFAKTDRYETVRYDFWCTVNRMFSENYMKTIQSWCHAHQCSLTGHIMMEESIFSQMTSTAGVMPFYEYEDIPGIDWLRRRIDAPVTPKQVGSVACQLGKKQVLTESFALCGWGVTFEELKWIAEWQFVNGVNQICQHLMAYDIRGVRKRDYPPSHFYQQTWWKDASLFNDYLARECVALSYGDQTADVLLIHPMRSGFIAYDGTRTEEIRKLDDEFIRASVALSGQHISYHYGDETIIAKYGRVSGTEFNVGRIVYRTVILPCMYAIDGHTLRMLYDFVGNGGEVLSLGELPSFTNGEQELLKRFTERVKKVSYDNLRDVLTESGLLSISISSQKNGREQIADISYEKRKLKGRQLYFIVNHSQEKEYDAEIRILGFKGVITKLIPENGQKELLTVRYTQKDTCVSLKFSPMQSYILLADPDRVETGSETEDYRERKIQYVELGKRWKTEDSGLNSITLDYCDFSVDGGEWENNVPVIKVQAMLLALRRPCDVKLRFSFQVSFADADERNMSLVVEDASRYEIRVNGMQIEEGDRNGVWKDRSFNSIRIGRYVKTGLNEILLGIRFRQPQKVYDVLFGENVYETEINKITYDVELESVYVTGNFGVYARNGMTETDRHALLAESGFELSDLPEELNGLELTHQGMLFYADIMTVSQKLMIKKEKGSRQILRLGQQRAPLIKVYINGKLVKNSMWAPYEADITDFCIEGENTVTLKLYATNRNLLGPHHHIHGECYNVGPESFTGKWSWVERNSEADATDISDREKNYWTDNYSFIKFGLE